MMRIVMANFLKPRAARTAFAAILGATLLLSGAQNLVTGDAFAREKSDSSDKKKSKEEGKEKAKGKVKSEPLGTFGDWSALVTPGKDKTCYALGAPKERQPKAKLKDTQAYIFISTRPSEGVRNEVAINLGYATKDGGAATADVDDDKFELVTKGVNAWVKNPAKEKEFVEALRTGSKLYVKAASAKGTTTVDSYSLKGLSDALGRVAQECK